MTGRVKGFFGSVDGNGQREYIATQGVNDIHHGANGIGGGLITAGSGDEANRFVVQVGIGAFGKILE